MAKSRQRVLADTYQERGGCRHCGRVRPAHLKLRCQAHQDKWNVYVRGWIRKRRAVHICPGCGGPIPTDLTLRCRPCQDKWNHFQRTGEALTT